MAEKKFFITKEKLEADYRELRSTLKVAEKHGVSKKLVMNYMKRFEIPVLRRRTAAETDELIRKHLEAGNTSAEVAEAVGLTRESVNASARRIGIVPVNRYHKGEIITHNGYRMIKAPYGHPGGDSKGYIREHRLVMERKLGRFLDPGEVVHHINHDKLDNRPENLEVMTLAEHTSSHHAGVPKPRRSKR